MKKIVTALLLAVYTTAMVTAQATSSVISSQQMKNATIIKIESHISGLQLAITCRQALTASDNYPVLFLHGASFPTALAFAFKMNNYSWMDNLAENGYNVYALDFLGYGYSSRYPVMQAGALKGDPIGRAADIYKDVDNAVNFILKKTGKSTLYLIAHSWGGSVAALYATKFPAKLQKLVLFAAITPGNDTGKSAIITNSYERMTPAKRIEAMKNLTPQSESCLLEPEIFNTWGNTWLASDPLERKNHSKVVSFPSGPLQDVEDMLHNKPYYNPADIKTPVLFIRGSWDAYPSDANAKAFIETLQHATIKKYVTINNGTHVMHLEKNRYALYKEVLSFLQD